MESSRSGFDEEDAIDEKFYTGKEEYMTEKKKQEMEMEQAIKAQKRWTQITSTCPYCYGSSQMSKDNLMFVFVVVVVDYKILLLQAQASYFFDFQP